jgi:hypothetical protein
MKIDLPRAHDWQQQQQQTKQQRSKQQQQQQQQQQQHPEVLDLLLGGKPLVCLAFSDMEVRAAWGLQCAQHSAGLQCVSG